MFYVGVDDLNKKDPEACSDKLVACVDNKCFRDSARATLDLPSVEFSVRTLSLHKGRAAVTRRFLTVSKHTVSCLSCHSLAGSKARFVYINKRPIPLHPLRLVKA